MKSDKYNDEILRILQKDGRIANTELSQRVGLSPSACLRRVQELERQGVICGYRASVDLKKLGIGFTAYVTVGLGEHTKRSQEAFEQAITLAEEVIECHNVTGSFEYILRVETTDLVAYKRFHTDVLGTLPQVATISTHVVMESNKDLRA
ncbi:Lrp/AsnC family transcriptional regulator [Aestuariibacter sp. AA17]|uniref:Leucine-responsive regulatory protein n=1 Tax=Fluctibacter corallii TaxID=2984329 RepID=A0ABT3A7B6_9ALTE|nr:Lrp/AsnC family transcriptional regulator [Aestuariibacter sp. AA17]MCV2884539.1 Lrp/AsnC family transcriptional regulator [Aestuariibacter sp. AA17]